MGLSLVGCGSGPVVDTSGAADRATVGGTPAPAPAVPPCIGDGDGSGGPTSWADRQEGWVGFAGIVASPEKHPKNFRRYADLDGVVRVGGGSAVDQMRRVNIDPKDLALLLAEVPRTARFIGYSSESVQFPAQVPGLVEVFAIRPDGSAFNLNPCGQDWNDTLRTYGASRGLTSPQGFPAALIDEILTDPDGLIRYQEWVRSVQEAASATAPKPTTWIDLPPDRRQVVPGETPPEYLSTLKTMSIVLKVPTDWLPESSPNIDMSKVSQLCVRTVAGYGMCRVFVRGSEQHSYTLFRLANDASAEIVLLHGLNYDASVTVLTEIDLDRISSAGGGVALSGSRSAPAVTYY